MEREVCTEAPPFVVGSSGELLLAVLLLLNIAAQKRLIRIVI